MAPSCLRIRGTREEGGGGRLAAVPPPRDIPMSGPSSAPLGWWGSEWVIGRQLSAAGGAGPVPAGQERLELPDDPEQGQAAALVGGRRRRSRVRNACATETSVTWWFQPG